MNKLEITTYFKTISASRISLNSVPAEFKEFVQTYQEHYDSNDLPCNAHHNAMVSVFQTIPQPVNPTGNCPRCSGTGYIKAYSHIQNGKCLKCSGSGNIH